MKLPEEKKKNKVNKLYNPKQEDESIMMQYAVDTYLTESLYFLYRDKFF